MYYNGKEYNTEEFRQALGIIEFKGDINKLIKNRVNWEKENLYMVENIHTFEVTCCLQGVNISDVNELSASLKCTRRQAFDTIMYKENPKRYKGSKVRLFKDGVEYNTLLDYYLGTGELIHKYGDTWYKNEESDMENNKRVNFNCWYHGRGFRNIDEACNYYGVDKLSKRPGENNRDMLERAIHNKKILSKFGINRALKGREKLENAILKELGANQVSNTIMVRCPICGFYVAITEDEKEQFVNHNKNFCKAHVMEVI